MANGPTRQRALVTGASAGLGEVFASRLAGRGYDLVITARRKDRLDALAERLAAAHDIAVEAVGANLATDEGVSLVEEHAQRSDLLVNNAGFGTVGEFAELPLERELEELDLNVRALVRLTHAALRGMGERGRGSIINVASTAAFQPIPYNATYAATKTFVLHFSEALHEEAKKRGVTVTCVCPGPVRTEFQQVAGIREGTVPGAMWSSAESVVDAALLGSRVGRAYVVPGMMNAVTAMSGRFAPRFVTRKIAGAFFRDRRA